jgi:hypothetical protein
MQNKKLDFSEAIVIRRTGKLVTQIKVRIATNMDIYALKIKI